MRSLAQWGTSFDVVVRSNELNISGLPKFYLKVVSAGDIAMQQINGESSSGMRERIGLRFSVLYGEAAVRMLDDIPETRTHRNYRSYLLMIENAQQRIWVTNPYFLPPDSLLEALGDAAKRGVDVRLMFPGVNDSATIRLAMQSL